MAPVLKCIYCGADYKACHGPDEASGCVNRPVEYASPMGDEKVPYNQYSVGDPPPGTPYQDQYKDALRRVEPFQQIAVPSIDEFKKKLGLPLDKPVIPIVSDGGSTDYYKLPEGSKDLIDLIEHKDMSFAIGNIFKACYRYGEKDGASKRYDLNKIIFFAQRALNKLDRDEGRA